MDVVVELAKHLLDLLTAQPLLTALAAGVMVIFLVLNHFGLITLQPGGSYLGGGSGDGGGGCGGGD